MNKLVKENTKNFIIEQATQLFLSKSITGVTMSDIAHHVGIGDATLYRYFAKKQNIVMQASAKLAEKVYGERFNDESSLNGYEQLSFFYNAYLDIFKNNNSYFRFIDELDAYILNEKEIQKTEYENDVNIFKSVFDRGYEKGIADGSVNPVEDRDNFYYSTTHALLNMCKFLSTADALQQDKNINKEKELQILIDVILKSLKK